MSGYVLLRFPRKVPVRVVTDRLVPVVITFGTAQAAPRRKKAMATLLNIVTIAMMYVMNLGNWWAEYYAR
jgi:hypothetical protein